MYLLLGEYIDKVVWTVERLLYGLHWLGKISLAVGLYSPLKHSTVQYLVNVQRWGQKIWDETDVELCVKVGTDFFSESHVSNTHIIDSNVSDSYVSDTHVSDSHVSDSHVSYSRDSQV